MNAHRTRAYISLIVVAGIWGVASSVIKFTLGQIDPLPFLVYRFFIAGLLGLFFLIIDWKNTKVAFKNLPSVVLFGILAYSVGLLSLFLGLDLTTVLATTLIATTGPLVGTVMGAVFLKETITGREKLGTLIAFLGALFVVLAPRLGGNSNGFGHLLGNLLILLYILGDRGATVYAKHSLRKKVNSFTIVNIGMILAFLTLTPVAIYQYGLGGITSSVVGLDLAHHMGVWFMAFISGTLAYNLWVGGMKHIEISEAGLFTYLSPIFATPLAVLWIGESLTVSFVIGAIVIALGVGIAEFKK